jgi:hypothetical protein
MTHPKILQPGKSYTFSRFFEMAVDPGELLAEFGYGLSKAKLVLPQQLTDIDVLALQAQLEEDLTYVDLSSEAARREILIAPILLRVCRSVKSKLKIEYSLNPERGLIPRSLLRPSKTASEGAVERSRAAKRASKAK